MKRKVQPAARPANSRTGQAIGSEPPKSRTRRPVQGKRKANAVRPRSPRPAETSARTTATTSTGNRSGAPAGKPRNSSTTPPETARTKSRIRTPVPGLRPPFGVTDRSSDSVIVLQRRHAGRSLLSRADALDGRGRCRERRQARDAEAQGRGPNGCFVVMRLSAQGSVDDELNLARLHAVYGIGPSLVDLENELRRQARLGQGAARPLGRAE